MRLGQRLSGGLAVEPGAKPAGARKAEVIRLVLPKGEEALYGETVDRRLKKLAVGARLQGARWRTVPMLPIASSWGRI